MSTIGFSGRFEKHLRHLIANTHSESDLAKKIEITIQHYEGNHDRCDHGAIKCVSKKIEEN